MSDVNRRIKLEPFDVTFPEAIQRPPDEVFFTEQQLGARWQLKSVKKLQADRVKGVGVPWVRIGRLVRYRLVDVLAFEAANIRRSTSDIDR